MSRSEIAQLRQDMELTCQSMKLALTGFAITAPHFIIQHKYRQLGRYQERLGELIGEEQSVEEMVDIYNKVVK